MASQAHKILVLLQLDAQSLMERIEQRKKEYLYRFNLSRSRDHFPDVFENRYKKIDIMDLKSCNEETIIALDNFYKYVENLYWYFKQTEDMGVAMEDHTEKAIKDLKGLYTTLTKYLRAELA